MTEIRLATVRTTAVSLCVDGALQRERARAGARKADVCRFSDISIVLTANTQRRNRRGPADARICASAYCPMQTSSAMCRWLIAIDCDVVPCRGLPAHPPHAHAD